MEYNAKEFVFEEKYRPTKLKDMVLPEDVKEKFRAFIDTQIPHLLLSSRQPGTGKSTLAKVLIHETQAEALFLNASLYPNIDVLRSKIQNFVQTNSFNGVPKIVVLDEGDGLNQNSTQPALRGFIEQYSKNARFIITCNDISSIIEPIRDRMLHIDFDEMYKNKKEIVPLLFKRLQDICDNEGITYTKEDLINIIKSNYPSTRSTVKFLQEYSQNNKLILPNLTQKTDILEVLKSKNFDDIKNYVDQNDIAFSELYDIKMKDPINGCIILAKYQMYDSQVRDKKINTLACLLELMEMI
jgi:replication factor C small subunit